MIKKVNEYISEGLWKTGIERSRTGQVRKEVGTKVMTCLGTPVILENPHFDYNQFIHNLLDENNKNPYVYHPFIKPLASYCRKDKVLNGDDDYAYLINNIEQPNDPFVLICFEAEWDDEFDDGFDLCSEKDLISIYRCIAETINNNKIIFHPHGFWHTPVLMSGEETNKLVKSEGNVMGESSAKEKYFELQKKFEKTFDEKFPHVGVLVDWLRSGVSACKTYGLEISDDTITNYPEYRQFALDFFGIK